MTDWEFELGVEGDCFSCGMLGGEVVVINGWVGLRLLTSSIFQVGLGGWQYGEG